MSTRPLCQCCFRPLAKLTRSINFKPGEEPATIDEVRKLTNAHVISVRKGRAERYLTTAELSAMERKHAGTKGAADLHGLTNVRTTDETRGMVIYAANVWDGESYRETFCTNQCAIRFAFAAHRAGYRISGKGKS